METSLAYGCEVAFYIGKGLQVMGIRSHANAARRTVAVYRILAVIAGLLLVVPPQLCLADVRSTLEEAFAKFEEGDINGAVEAFETAFAQDPSDDVLYNWMQAVGFSALYRMVRSENPRLSGIARQIIRLLSRVKLEKRSDEDEIRAAIEDAMSDDDARFAKTIQATSDYGRNLVPHLIPYLAHKELGKRTTAIRWVSDIGLDAVPILQAARKHPDSMVRLNVAKLFGASPLRNPVSLATLKAMMETDESAEVRAAAEVSFEAVLNSNRVRAAKRYFLLNAYRYYLKPHSNPFGTTNVYIPTVYSLHGDTVVGEAVAGFQLGERMARQALEEALELDPNYRSAYVMSLCNDCAQAAEYDQNVAYYAEQSGDESIRSLLSSQRGYVDSVLRLRILSAPTDVLYRGLRQALDDGRSDVAGKIIETIRETRRRGEVPSALIRALEDENSRLVRIAAAITLAEWNPAENFDAGEMVVSILSEAVVSSGVRVIQKVMGDRRRANRFDDLLRELHMESYSPWSTIEEGYVAVINSPPDAVLIDEDVTLTNRPDSVAPINLFVTQLRKNYRTANVPVIVTVPESRAAAAKQLYESEERKVYVVSDGIDRLGLKNLVLDRLFAAKRDAKTRATRLSAGAAQALADLAGASHSLIPVENSVESLIKVLRNRPDEVRVPCIQALGRMRAAEAAEELSVVFANEQNAVAVRAAAMTAVGDVLQGSSSGASDSVLSTIKDGMALSSLALRRAAWYAFSGAAADGASRLGAMLASAAPEGEAAVSGEESLDADADTADDDDEDVDDDDDFDDDDDDGDF